MKSIAVYLSVFILASCHSMSHEAKTEESPKVETIAEPLSVDTDEDIIDIVDENKNFLQRKDVQRFINREVNKGHYNREQLEDFFSKIQYKPSIITVMDKPGTSQPWYVFSVNNASSSRITKGKSFWKTNQEILDQVSTYYGVPASLIVAIMGIETNYGTTMGSYRVADALATLSFYYPRRAAYFQQELAELLQLAYEEKNDLLEFQGSFAGAMGMPQFMPSSFRNWAVDWNKDGHRDIWHDVGDTAASIANYMKQHGWRSGEPIAVPVQLTLTPKIKNILAEKTELNYTAGQLRHLGIHIPARIGNQEKAILFQLEIAPDKYEYWLGLNNFYTIWKYNHSRHYVAAVRKIANGVTDKNDL